MPASATNWVAHKDARLGAALAYYSIFSLGPITVIAMAVAGLFFGADVVQGEVSAAMYSIHFLVYDDSFPVFLNARQVPLGRGYDTGWEFLPQGQAVVFSSRGEAPPAL